MQRRDGVSLNRLANRMSRRKTVKADRRRSSMMREPEDSDDSRPTAEAML